MITEVTLKDQEKKQCQKLLGRDLRKSRAKPKLNRIYETMKLRVIKAQNAMVGV